ncbi:MAG: nucleotide exchange factor GrpE [Bacteroidia bacterium]|nr:nucleotide exchange factor GrpE [Bacteroidia bacterium]MCO5253015.1 nucleotide exchange factor GrpE [Bacteroidota bacterium]MCZ2131141.1 nucleotide exchange factor GrpE [Bacteroidia bacterium]
MSKKDKHPKEEVNLNTGETVVESLENPLQEELNAVKKQLKEQEDKYLRLYAEFDNFRKRNAKERLELIQNAAEETLAALLPVLDDFERSLKAANEQMDGLKEGVELVFRKFNTTLESKGLKKMDSLGKEFDHDFQEAVTQIAVEDKNKMGKVVDVIEEGYMLNDKVIRFAKVVIGA